MIISSHGMIVFEAGEYRKRLGLLLFVDPVIVGEAEELSCAVEVEDAQLRSPCDSKPRFSPDLFIEDVSVLRGFD